jgi:inosose dehydratase
MTTCNRRDFFKITGAGATAGAVSFHAKTAFAEESKSDGNVLTLGMASYTLREFTVEEALAMTKRLDLKKIAFKSMHLPLDSTEEFIDNTVKKVKAAGLDLYGAGVVYMKDEKEVDQAFEYARMAGMKVIIGVPEHELLALVEKKVQNYDIKVAIHNHGPGDEKYPSPASVYEKIKDLDPRIGLCIDIGHTQRIGLDPSEEAKKYADRLHDIHIKDVTASTAEGKTVEIGRGIIDIPKFLRTLIEIKYKGVVSLEYEKDAKDPLPGSAESVGFLRGVLSVI